MKTQSRLIFWSGMIGNTLDHYDIALYVFLIPVTAPIFFPNIDPVISLICAFAMKSTSIISKPIGALLFGKLAFKYSTKNLLSITLAGVGIGTFCVGLIPGYQQIGVMAPILLILVRTVQGIFAAGEYTIATVFVMDQIKDKTKIGRSSTVLLFSTMCGSLLASCAATLVSKSSHPEIYWRYAFLAGLATTIPGIILRMMIKYPDQQITSAPLKTKSTLKLVIEHRDRIFKIIIITSFSWITYLVPFIFLNSFVPLISLNKVEDLLLHTTILLVINNAMIPIIMTFIDKLNIIKWMAIMSGLFCISIIPIFLSLPYLSIIGIDIVKLWIIILGVCFSSTFSALIFKMSKGPEKYIVTGFGYSLGSEILGRNASVFCLGLWHISKSLLAPALYLMIISFLTTYILIKEYKNNSLTTSNI